MKRGMPRAVAAFVLIVCVVYAPMFAGGTLHFRDLAEWIFPAFAFMREAVAHGDWPLWNPYQGIGFSALGNPLYGLFYPPYLLVHVVPPDRAVTWLLFLHALWGGAGFLWLARRLGARPEGAVVAGIAWTLSGFVSAEWNTGVLLPAASWIPWIALALVRVADAATRGARPVGRAAAVAALPIGLAFLLGEVFIAFIAVGFGALLAACTLAFRAEGAAGPAAWRRFVAGVALGGAAGASVGAVAVWPARMAAGGTERAVALSRAVAEGCSLHPARIVEMVAPQLLGHPFGDLHLIGQGCVDDQPILYSVYLGASVLALAIAALGRRRRLETALAILAVGALLVALGRHLPAHAVLRTLVPPLAFMRHPEKYVAFVLAPICLLASLGVGRWLDTPAPGSRPWRRVAGLTLALMALAGTARALLPGAFAVGVSGALVRGGAAAGAILVVGALVSAGDRWLSGLRRFVPAALVAVVAVDLGAASSVLLDFGPRRLASDVPRAAAEILSHNSGAPAPARIYRPSTITKAVQMPAARSYPEAQRRRTETLVANTANAFDVANVVGYDAAIPVELLRTVGQGRGHGTDMLRLLAVSHTILPVADPSDPTDRRPDLRPLFDPLPGVRLYRVPDALPRVYLAGSAAVLDDEPARAQLFSADVVTGDRVLLAPTAGSRPLSGVPGRAGTCTLETFSETHLAIRCRAEREAVAVLVEQYDPGWSARVDGTSAPLLRANLIERGVILAPGEHRIEMTFAPRGLALGAVVSAVGLLAIVLGLALTRSRSRPGETSVASAPVGSSA